MKETACGFMIWYELVLLFYFISAVEAAFAYQADNIAVRCRLGVGGHQLHRLYAVYPLSRAGVALVRRESINA